MCETFEKNVLSLEVLLYGRLKIDFENQSQIAWTQTFCNETYNFWYISIL